MPDGVSMVKGHAYGNDFLLAPESDVKGRDCAALARAACSRHEGIGADGLMIYTFEPSSVRMRLYNADGSQSEVSGNGIRCLAALAVRERPGTTSVTIDTPAGPKVLQLQDRERRHADVPRRDGDAAGYPVHRAGRSRSAHSGGVVVGRKSAMCADRRCPARIATPCARSGRSNTIGNFPIARTCRSRKLKRRTGSAS